MLAEHEEKPEHTTAPLEQPFELETTSERASLNPAVTEGFGNTALIAVKSNELPQSELAPFEQTPEQKLDLAEKWINDQDTAEQAAIKDIPKDIAFEVALLLQKRWNILNDDDIVEAEFFQVAALRNKAVEAADELGPELLHLGKDDWTFHVLLNSMHDKFKNVPTEELSRFLGSDDGYEYRALRIRNIIADHAPALLTENLRVLVDPSQSAWRAASAHASILLSANPNTNINGMHIEQVASSLPIGSREEYESADNDAMEYIAGMSDEELALYCQPQFMAAVKERGYALFGELNLPGRESLLTRRLFEAAGKSNSPDSIRLASERNKEFEHLPTVQQGDLVHATPSAEVLKLILSNGLKCGEAILGNDRSIINFPFTVSFLEVNEDVARQESVAGQLALLKNKNYGAINLVFHRDESSTEYVRSDATREYQRQVFGGVPSSEITSIIIRDEDASQQTIDGVVQAVVDHGMFIPIYAGSTGESLLTSQQFDQLSASS